METIFWNGSGSSMRALIKKLPAFLRGRAATHFYAIPADERATYDESTKKLNKALCPPVERENYYVKFELTQHSLRKPSLLFSAANLCVDCRVPYVQDFWTIILRTENFISF